MKDEVIEIAKERVLGSIRNDLKKKFDERLQTRLDEELKKRKVSSERNLRIVKASSLGISGTIFAVGIGVKLIQYLSELTFEIPSYVFEFPKISFEQGVIVAGLISFLPFVIITLYEKIKR